MADKMRNAPIFLTIGQIRFNPILQMSEYVDVIQTRFRKIGYPDFAHDEFKELQVDTSTVTPKVDVATTPRWRFKNAETTSEFLLFRNSLVFQTTSYETSDEFFATVVSGIQLINETVDLSFIESVGVRTLDAVLPGADEDLRDYLRPHLLGFYNDNNLGQLQHNILESAFAFGQSGLSVRRVVIMRGALGLPIDLVPLQLVLQPKFASVSGFHAVLDNDRIERGRFNVSIEEITGRLKQMKAGVTEAFYSAVTETALKRWR